MGAMIIPLWIIGFLASIAFFFTCIDDYKQDKKTIKPILITGIVSFVLGVPVLLALVLLIGLSTGLVGM